MGIYLHTVPYETINGRSSDHSNQYRPENSDLPSMVHSIFCPMATDQSPRLVRPHRQTMGFISRQPFTNSLSSALNFLISSRCFIDRRQPRRVRGFLPAVTVVTGAAYSNIVGTFPVSAMSNIFLSSLLSVASVVHAWFAIRAHCL